MIKSYQFPQIFQNIVGEVVPLRRTQHFKSSIIDERQFGSHLDPNKMQACRGINTKKAMHVISNKKPIQRRRKQQVRTQNVGIHLKSEQQGQQELSQNRPEFSQFLKKGSSLNKSVKKMTWKDFDSSQFQQENQLQSSSSFISRYSGSFKRGNSRQGTIRFKTTIDHIHYEGQEEQKVRSKSKKGSSIKRLKSRQDATEKSFGLQRSGSRKATFRIERTGERKRTKMKKKTVNFTSQLAENNRNFKIKNNQCKSSKSNLKSIKSQKNDSGSSSSVSQKSFTSKSHQITRSFKSIKFSSCKGIRSTRSIASRIQDFSNQTSQIASIKVIIPHSKRRKRNGTFTHLIIPIQIDQLSIVESSQSLKLEDEDKEKVVMKQNAKYYRRFGNKKRQNEIDIEELKKFNIKSKPRTTQVKRQRESLFVPEDSQSQDYSGSHRFLQVKPSARFIPNKSYRTSRRVDNLNAFLELDNFHRFLHSNDVEEDGNQVVATFKKPMVIDNHKGLRGRLRNEAQARENQMLDMGLKLVRNMGRLVQKNM